MIKEATKNSLMTSDPISAQLAHSEGRYGIIEETYLGFKEREILFLEAVRSHKRGRGNPRGKLVVTN